ncbi:ATP-binding protein [Pseudogemmatithrix spongiicola]|uniref:histidine kinase n=1 Tax=Pseudogemmatithrix spongiicola TaxID=3062599 RepID=A0AA49JY32_9BACT|nr:ATP-binding protein [Gemmatimonadaceae bacterium 'strain 138']WKW14131.1 ATP-binding protein [Gemmatimonadaceae bacterium 'strain 318']
MSVGSIPRHAYRPYSTPALVAWIAMAGLVTYAAGPVLRHMEFAVIPWPLHGLAVAILFSSRERDRPWTAIALSVAIILGAGGHSGDWMRSITGTAQLMAQTIAVVLFHQWLSGGRHPLRGALSYAWLGVVVLLGSLPTTLLATLIVEIVGPQIAPGYTTGEWWVSAVSSMYAIAPILLAQSAPARIEVRASTTWRWELPLLAAVYAIALVWAFFEPAWPRLQLPAAVATVPFLVWAGLRFGVRGYAVFAAMFVVAVIASTVLDVGPFGQFGDDPIVRGRRAWIYVASLAGPTMIFPLTLVERAIAEARARGAFAQLAAIIESSGDPIAAIDHDLVIIAVNPAWVRGFHRISGVTVRPGMRMDDVLESLPMDRDESVAHWRRALQGHRFTAIREVGDPALARDEFEITYSPVRDEQGDIVGASQVVRNVTDRRKHESAEAETRRLEALGRLAGGVAHDFNNLMTAVVGYAGILAQSLPAHDPRQADLAEIERAATRAGELTQQLLAFARRRVVAPKVVDVGDLVGGFMRLLDPLLGSTVRLNVRIGTDLPDVRIDPAQFEQVLMNLAVNARDAMPNGGELGVDVVRTRYRDGVGVRVSVRDTGTGMEPEVVARIWEPFFTTKPQGKGTGLGLATVHGIVHQAGGEIGVESTLGVGTTFNVLLPGVDPDDSAVAG